MKKGMSRASTGVRDASCEPNKDANVTSRSKKKYLAELFKKVVDSNSRVPTQCDSTIGLYQKSVQMSMEVNKKAQDEVSTANKTHNGSLSYSKSIESHSVRKKSTASEPGFKTPTPCGLENLGNTCYLNAIMQCLRSTEPVHQFCEMCDGVRSKPSKNSTGLVPAFIYLLSKMNTTTNGSVSSSTLQRFKNAFVAHVPTYKGNLQQDALEFFTYLVDGLHEGIKERSQNSSVSDPLSSPTTPSTPLPPIQRDHTLKRRRGGLKKSESSGYLTGGDREASRGDFSELPAPSLKKIAQKLSKILRPPRSKGSYDVLHETHQPAVSSADATASEDSFLKDTFVGHLQTRLRCLQCNNLTTRDELFWNLSLCVPEVDASSEREAKDKRANAKTSTSSSTSAISSPTSVATCVSLDDCLKTFTKAEILDDVNKPNCNKCKARNKAELQIKISKLPKILVLQFQRFESSCCKTKKRNLIKFNFEQDMSPYYVDGSTDTKTEARKVKAATIPKCTSSPAILHASNDTEPQKVMSVASMPASTHKLDLPEVPVSTNYRLYAVVYHQGGTDRGHYTARCRLPSNPSNPEHASWYFFDDENVSKVSSDQDVVHPTAYILFYMRIDPEPNADVPSTKPTEVEESSYSAKKVPVKFTTTADED